MRTSLQDVLLNGGEVLRGFSLDHGKTLPYSHYAQRRLQEVLPALLVANPVRSLHHKLTHKDSEQNAAALEYLDGG